MLSSAAVLVLGVSVGLLVASAAAFFVVRAMHERSHAYLKGVRSLLEEDADAAIEALTRAARMSRDTLETYFALAAVFRKKGDFERAIRIHQNIGLMGGLAPAVKLDALERLGEDYRAAGMLGKAVESYERLVAQDASRKSGWLALADLLAELERHEEALAAGGNAGAPAGDLAHLAAQGALVAARSGDGARARGLAEAALRLDAQCAAAELAMGTALAVSGEQAAALESWARGLAHAPTALELVLPDMEAALPEARLEEFLRAHVAQNPRQAGARVALARLLRKLGRTAEAAGELDEAWSSDPGLSVPARAYRCQACGTGQIAYDVRCPACHAWGRIA